MDNSEPRKEGPLSTSMAMARALVSASVFGALGATLGSWLGRRGSAPENAMAKPIMKWSMGAFWALVAAYSSLKSSEQERKADPSYTHENYHPNRPDMPAKVAGPETAIDAASVSAEGKTIAARAEDGLLRGHGA